MWVMDEAGLGLHTELRRVWTLRGRRPVVTRQIKYQWDYLYGALSLGAGTKLRAAMKPAPRRFWEDPGVVLRLIGRPWMHAQLNASH